MKTIEIITKEEKATCRQLLKFLLNKGCKQARITFTRSVANSFSFQKKALDRLEGNNENRVFLEIFVNNRFGSFSSNRINIQELEKFASDSILAVKLLEEDPFRKLPDSSRYYKGNDNLNLFDDYIYNISTEEKFEIIHQSLGEIDLDMQQLVTAEVSYEDSLSSVYMIDSNGFENEKQSTVFSIGAGVTLSTEGEARVESSDYEMYCKWDKLTKKGILEKALAKANRKTNQKKIASGVYEMITDNKSTGKFIHPILSAISGSSLDQKRSFLDNRKGEKVFSDKLSVSDKPFQQEKLGSRLYDGEGVATSNNSIIEKGVLQRYFISTYYSGKLDMEPTIASPTGICLQNGERNIDEIIANTQHAIYVTGYNGGNSNPTTGDFSFGVEGFLIENGKITKAINEMNITGNFIELWNNVKEVGNDPRLNTSNQIPSMVFENVKFSGI